MAGDYLDSTGLGKVWAKVKGLFTRPHFYKQVTVQDDDFNVDVSQNGLYVKNLQFTDADGDQIGWLQNNHDGASYGISIGCSTPDDSANNQMLLGITPTGTPSAWFSQAGTVRNALGAAASSHTHGSISNTGAITSDTAAASGDKLVIADDSDSSKLKRSGIALGTDTTTFLRNDGTWAAPSGGGGGVTYTTQAVSIATSAWSGGTATVSASAVTASNDVIVTPAPASMAAWAAAGVYCSAQGAGTLTFTCSTAPSAALTANVMAFDGAIAQASGESF